MMWVRHLQPIQHLQDNDEHNEHRPLQIQVYITSIKRKEIKQEERRRRGKKRQKLHSYSIYKHIQYKYTKQTNINTRIRR